MSDDTTEALNRIAAALELQAHINATHRRIDQLTGREGGQE